MQSMRDQSRGGARQAVSQEQGFVRMDRYVRSLHVTTFRSSRKLSHRPPQEASDTAHRTKSILSGAAFRVQLYGNQART